MSRWKLPSRYCFNSRAREGRDATGAPPKIEKKFQFTRPRGARLVAAQNLSRKCYVSIHAPARGATCRRSRYSRFRRFQFTRPRGARPIDARAISARASFNSRAREGRDVKRLAIKSWPRVSIHAPARGATANPNRRRGPVGFQFTRPRGARPRFNVLHSVSECFNSRAREGRDWQTLSISGTLMFQFTRPRGARHPNEVRGTRRPGFNSRAREGRDEVRLLFL